MAKARNGWEAESYGRQELARGRSIAGWSEIRNMAGHPPASSWYVDNVYREYGKFMESPYFFPPNPEEQKKMYDYPNPNGILGKMTDFPVRDRDGEIIVELPYRFIDPASLAEYIEYAMPCLEYDFIAMGDIWPEGRWAAQATQMPWTSAQRTT